MNPRSPDLIGGSGGPMTCLLPDEPEVAKAGSAAGAAYASISRASSVVIPTEPRSVRATGQWLW
jgi:hypothetical protein